MATWIVHLRLAEKLLQTIPGLDEAGFAVGSVAPDSGIPDENWEHFDPPPEVTHFRINSQASYKLNDLVFYRSCLEKNQAADPKEFSFLLGYFFHLVTDNRWTLAIGRPTRDRFIDQFNADPGFIWEVKRDWYGLDFIYLRDHPGWRTWEQFKAARYDQAYLDFLPLPAVQQHLTYIKRYYETITDEVREALLRPFIYLSYLSIAEMDTFVNETAAGLAQVYKLLWEDHCDPGELESALQLLSQ